MNTLTHHHRTSSRRLALGAIGLLFVASIFSGQFQPTYGQDDKKPAAAIVTTSGSDVAEVVQIINTKMREGWTANKITPSARASDYEFIRRASLDIIGRIARPDEVARFLKDPASTRRAQLIDRLLASDEYAKNWSNIWTVWLLTRSGSVDPVRRIYHLQMHRWLEEQFQNNISHKQLAMDLITARGRTNDNGAVNFVLAHLGEPIPRDAQQEEGRFEMVPITSRTTRLFLGLQTQCTQCHDHPFNPEWKQEHFWGINAFFRQVERGGSPNLKKPKKEMVTPVLELRDNFELNPKGEVIYEKRSAAVMATKPRFLDGKKPVLSKDTSGPTRRDELARFMTDSPYFGKAFVNRMWGHFLGRGFAHPVDDFGEHNPVSHPELLEELGKKFAHYGHDSKRLIRWICNSEPYQLSSTANKSNDQQEHEKFFSRMLLKSMSPEQLYESLITATRAEVGEDRDARNRLRQDWMSKLVVNFGDDEGNEATFNGTVVQALLLMNGDDMNKAITYKNGTVMQSAARRGGNAAAIMGDLYMAALNRPPTANEISRVTRVFATAPTKSGGAVSQWQDLFWALLNSNEFILNH